MTADKIREGITKVIMVPLRAFGNLLNFHINHPILAIIFYAIFFKLIGAT